MTERFFATLKRKSGYARRYAISDEALRDVANYIEVFPRRPHASSWARSSAVRQTSVGGAGLALGHLRSPSFRRTRPPPIMAGAS